LATEVLLLGSNKFDGSIDQILKGKLNLIEGLYLSDNQFSGTIPTALCGLTGLSKSFLKLINYLELRLTDLLP
jgi:hypothetical protein